MKFALTDLTTQELNVAHTAIIKHISAKLEGFETDLWAAERVLDFELMTPNVIDPCVGFWRLADVASARGHKVITVDIYQWDDKRKPDYVQDFLTLDIDLSGFTVFMNPPFSKACEFIDHARKLGARKVICFQRYAWREGAINGTSKRGEWWENNPPARTWVCGDRAQCLRFDLRGQKISKPPTVYAFFVWEKGHRGAEITRGLYK